MGQSRWNDDDKIWSMRTPNFPCHESTVPRNAEKQRRLKIIKTLLCWWWKELKVFSNNYFCSSAQSIFGAAWASNLTKTTTLLTDNPSHEDLLQKVPRTSGKALTTESGDQYSYWCRIFSPQLTSVSISWQWTQKNSDNLQNQWLVVSTLCQEMENLTRNVGFKGTPKFDPCWKSQPVICKVNMEWKLELNL